MSRGLHDTRFCDVRTLAVKVVFDEWYQSQTLVVWPDLRFLLHAAPLSGHCSKTQAIYFLGGCICSTGCNIDSVLIALP